MNWRPKFRCFDWAEALSRPLPGAVAFALRGALLLTMWGCTPANQETTDALVPSWSLAEDPEVIVSGGEMDGDSIFLTQIRGGAFSGDRDIVVAVGGTQNRLLFLDADGQIADAYGRKGEGPGEFGSISGVYYSDNQIAVWDNRNRRMSFFEGRSKVGEVPVEIGPRHVVVGVFADGSFVTTPSFSSIYHLRTLRGSERSWDAADFPYVSEGTRRPYHLWSQDGEPIRVLKGHVEPPPAAFLLEDVNGRLIVVHQGTRCLPEPKHVVFGSALWIADSQEGVLARLDRRGEISVLLSDSERPVVTRAIAEGIDQYLQVQDRGEPELTRRSKSETMGRLGAVGDPLPSVWSDIVKNRGGGVWLKTATCFPVDSTDTWQVVDSTGHHVANVELPSDVRVLAVDNKRVLLVVKDQYDVDHVAVFRVRQ